MSVTQTVFVLRAELPTREAWQRALAQHGFALVFDPEFDPSRDDGYVPCTLAGADAGFEYTIQDIATYVAEQDCPDRAQPRTSDTAVSFATSSRIEDLQAAMAAAAVLATISGGRVWSDEAGDYVDDALEAARELGTAEPPRPIATSIVELGKTEIATRELLQAGAAAVVPLCEVVSDARRPVETRKVAITILGQLRDRRAVPTLERFASDAVLGAVAREALAKLS